MQANTFSYRREERFFSRNAHDAFINTENTNCGGCRKKSERRKIWVAWICTGKRARKEIAVKESKVEEEVKERERERERNMTR